MSRSNETSPRARRAPRRLALVVIAAAGLALAPPRPAHACGPDFPVELLRQRDATLLELPEGVFLDEVARLVPAPGPYQVVTQSWDEDPAPLPATGGAEERALYDAGARAFRAGDRAAAARAFTALLELPPHQRHQRSTWAAYMLGRLRGADAIAAYRQVRALVDAGFADELGLAASSLGQEAREHLDRDETVTAVRLYAAQAALGHPDGGTSLLLVVRELIEAGREGELVRDEVGQRLLAIYLRTRGGELAADQASRVLAALAAIDGVAGADQLAAAAYRDGQWDTAARLVAGADDTATARWVRAKLALRAGDRAAAERLLAATEADLDAASDARARVCAERAVLATSEGRFTDALEHAWRARTLSPDTIYLAERVVTIDELTAFVERLPPDADHDLEAWETWGRPTAALLRDLLGRRLMRAGRHGEALRYLAGPHRLAAAMFAGALAEARRSDDPIVRARALYAASLLARRHGLEILGTTHAPDWGLYDAEYDPWGWPLEEEAPAGPGRWLDPRETRRVRRSAPLSPARYHYRHLASALAEAAADLLPRRSQAFAATLCVSARHVFLRDPERVAALWDRYIAEAPFVADVTFGQDCPEPAFERARRFLPRPPPARWPLALVGGACAAAALWLLYRLRPGRVAARP